MFKSTWTEVDGRRVHAKESVAEGLSEEAPRVVLVHGLGKSYRYMMPTAERLAEDARVWVPDLPGFGKSEAPEGVLGVEELAEVVGKWMRLVGIERAVVVGNSVGCSVVVELARREPERVERVVLQSPLYDPEERRVGRVLRNWWRNSRMEARALAKISAQDMLDSGVRRMWGTFWKTLRYPIEERLPGVSQPALVVRGDRDPICSQAWAERVAALLPEGRLRVVEGQAHTMVFTGAEALSRAVRDFEPEAE